MTEDVAIELSETGSKGRYIARVAGLDDVGELTYSRTSPTLIIVDHTGVPDSLRGRGIGVKLSERVVADAREQGFKIIPLCPFFKAQANRHRDWLDVIQG